MVEMGEEVHLDVGGIVIYRRVIGALFVGKYCRTLLRGERTYHVDVFGPAACHSLVEY